ncbi:hypothetical protein [Paenibacillus elgii]|uniref:hypothetical protein n=1 Tax=Paenibacillus elgii TaxID=189691 RepID=UPI000248D3B9|nr:hypothetical protein [Paenibacillus elgii]
MNQRMEEPKTMGECWEIYKRFGFTKPEKPLDDSIFPNARLLLRMHNAHLDEIEDLTKERDEYRKIADGYASDIRTAHKRWLTLQEANTAMREVLQWYGDKKNWQLGVTITMGSAHPHHEPIKCDKGERARAILAKIGEGEKP